MKNKIYKIVGISILIFTLVANLQYAFSDYGLDHNNLGSQLMAQTQTQTEVLDLASDGTETSESGGIPPRAECYKEKLVLCEGPFGVECQFTGRYGSPTTCYDAYCTIAENILFAKKHRCIKG